MAPIVNTTATFSTWGLQIVPTCAGLTGKVLVVMPAARSRGLHRVASTCHCQALGERTQLEQGDRRTVEREELHPQRPGEPAKNLKWIESPF